MKLDDAVTFESTLLGTFAAGLIVLIMFLFVTWANYLAGTGPWDAARIQKEQNEKLDRAERRLSAIQHIAGTDAEVAP